MLRNERFSARLGPLLAMPLGQHTDATARVFRCHDTKDQSQTDRSQLPLLVVHRARLLAHCEMNAFRRDLALHWSCHSGSTPTRRHAAFACAQMHAYSLVMIPKISRKQTEASCRSWLFTEPACWCAAKWALFGAIWPFAGHATRAAHRRDGMLRLRVRKRTRILLS